MYSYLLGSCLPLSYKTSLSHSVKNLSWLCREFFLVENLEDFFFPVFEGKKGDKIFTFFYINHHRFYLLLLPVWNSHVSSQARFPTRCLQRTLMYISWLIPFPHVFLEYEQIIWGFLLWNMCARGNFSCFSCLVCMIAFPEHTSLIVMNKKCR